MIHTSDCTGSIGMRISPWVYRSSELHQEDGNPPGIPSELAQTRHHQSQADPHTSTSLLCWAWNGQNKITMRKRVTSQVGWRSIECLLALSTGVKHIGIGIIQYLIPGLQKFAGSCTWLTCPLTYHFLPWSHRASFYPASPRYGRTERCPRQSDLWYPPLGGTALPSWVSC